MMPKKFVKVVVYVLVGALVISSLMMGAGFFL
ncbi:stressosome-associated protein Prli42 [Bacillus horti]|uniref:Stressosome-associated protein Prli42 n=1 Tax=Caldalkalibacillus horti TaxID=77523 RepID=A0ABT9W1X1_9BACI|nr:stressosome-associated protein Prli42 [Bacillus horti]MDQ0166845.1 hypothetical protein [Bacillus horti]